jgi:hypothetical protein
VLRGGGQAANSVSPGQKRPRRQGSRNEDASNSAFLLFSRGFLLSARLSGHPAPAGGIHSESRHTIYYVPSSRLYP